MGQLLLSNNHNNYMIPEPREIIGLYNTVCPHGKWASVVEQNMLPIQIH